VAKLQNILKIIHFATEFVYFCRNKSNIMDKSKLAKYESEIIYNHPGVISVTASLYSALCEPEIKPFTKDDLHRLYDYFKAMFKHQIEKNDIWSDEEKERKKAGVDTWLGIGECFDQSKMVTDPYYPPRPAQISVYDRIVFVIMANSVLAGLRKTLDVRQT
jgi:hypothetical protein